MLKFKVLDNNTGVIVTRQPREVRNDIRIMFIDAPDNAVAVFKTKNADFYRELENGYCSLPTKNIVGVVKVLLILPNESTTWICESLDVRVLSSGTMLIAPNEADISQKFADLKLENQALRSENKAIKKQIADILLKIENLYEGYDLV